MDNRNFIIYSFEEVEKILKFVSEKECTFEIKILNIDKPEDIIYITDFKYPVNNKTYYNPKYIIQHHFTPFYSERNVFEDVNTVITICEINKSKEFQVYCEEWEDENTVNLKPCRKG